MIEEDTSALPDIFIDTRHSSGTPIPFVVGRGDMIKGLEIGLASMTQGERSVFIIQPSYAYVHTIGIVSSCCFRACGRTLITPGDVYLNVDVIGME